MGTDVISGLSDGNHSLTVYNGYVDPHGQFFENGDPVTVYFYIETSSTTPTVPEFPFIIVILLIMALTLAVSFFKRKAR